jgi:hypothetical protein
MKFSFSTLTSLKPALTLKHPFSPERDWQLIHFVFFALLITSIVLNILMFVDVVFAVHTSDEGGGEGKGIEEVFVRANTIEEIFRVRNEEYQRALSSEYRFHDPR